MQKRSATVTILDARRMRFEHEAAPISVDERAALARADLLASVVAARPASLGCLDALAVDVAVNKSSYGASCFVMVVNPF